MKTHLLIIFTLLFTSCFKSSKIAENQEQLNQGNTEIIAQSQPNGTHNDSILIENKVLHPFSDIDSKDEFYICVRGNSLLEGNTIFKITKSDGTVILYEEFRACLLVGYEFEGDNNSVKEQEDFIISRINDFFNESNFTYPAISPEERFDEDYSDKEIWDEIKSDNTLIGFYYLIGEEDGRRIAFSKKKGKAVIFFNCC